ncbi:hypothetical protein [Halalkalicoccus sp. NIPERK01]|uniref:hypothetical protein n=1 Tax=Halalkalicoccus sp. NIPERK01 TaxID=3053469 RepID=UPI00256F1775|nr:hypothetical protein [Halalkalicoccus sp. NIPERK01]MDL5362456.1 hypothetical protein [Halalkalicoccus sp. NIPERK01]
MGLAEIEAAVRRPEYTGENRCTPCTAINVLLAAVLVAPVVAVSAPAALVLFVGCLLAIYLRGYLVPGTPELTKRYLPPAVLRLFGKDVPRTRFGDLDARGLWEALYAAGVVERRDAVALADDFRERWWAAIDERRDAELGEREVARMLDADEVAQRGDRAFSVAGNRLVRWDSRAAFLADVAAAAVFDERVEDWAGLDGATRRDLLERLRLLLDRCPDCSAPARRERERVDPCCQRSYTVVWTECEGCGALLAELSVPTADEDELAPLLPRADPPT